MASTHAKAPVGGATGHDGSPETEYNIRGRRVGGKLHQAGAKKWKPETSPTVSKAMVVHKVKVEAALEAKIVEALKCANAMIVDNQAVVAAQQMARLEAASNVAPFVSAAEGARERLIAAGLIS